MTTINVPFRLRRDTTQHWVDYNPILAPGEIGINTTLNKFKIGNGSTHWADLQYANILATDLESAINTHNADTTNVHGIADTAELATKTYVATTTEDLAPFNYVDQSISTLSNTASSTYVPQSDVGNPDGVASLDSNGQVPLSQLSNLIDSAPTALNTLNELAAALGDDADFAGTVTNSIATVNSSLNSLNTTVSQFDARIVSLELGLGI